MTKDKNYKVEDKVEKKPLRGITTKTFLLNVRKEPNIDSEIIYRLDYSSLVMIDEENSTDEWHKIRTLNNIEGYCMKEYITIKC